MGDYLNAQSLANPLQPLCLNYGWMGTIAAFLAAPEAEWLRVMGENYQHLYRHRAAATQQQAWLDSAQILRSQLAQLVDRQPDRSRWTLIFEYELPHEGGRRPDLVILAAGHILVFEFKQQSSPAPGALDQVAAYARDLAEYHRASSQHPVTAILVPTRQVVSTTVAQPDTRTSANWSGEVAGETESSRSRVQILAPNKLADYLGQLQPMLPDIEPITWVNADYAPLPTIVEAARCIFQDEPLPTIKRAYSAGIPDVIAYLNRLVDLAQRQQERHLVLITGVPGAGKTLVGLQFVHQNHLQQAGERQAVFLSGNGPLITVLQYALKSRVFVQPVRNFYIEHEARRQKAPREHVIVFDEAQRAWDADRMADKYGIDCAAASAVLRIAERTPDWCVVVGLLGEGQEIHVGEESGIAAWNQGLQSGALPWQVHCAPEIAAYFTDCGAASALGIDPDRLHTHPLLNLTTSLRSHLAQDVQTWVAHLLAGEIEQAAAIMPLLTQAGFDAYMTRDLEQAKAYCRDRYRNQPTKRYGLLASSRARNLAQFGIDNGYLATRRVKVGPWYSDPPDSPESCCALDTVMTEFGCQGLELDFPIVSWGNDLVWQGQTWVSSVRQKQVRNPLRLRLNSYRVLLTRGRDGFIVVVPPDAKLDSTYDTLRAAGLQVMP